MQFTRTHARLMILAVAVITAAGWYALHNHFTASAQDSEQTAAIEAKAASNGRIAFVRDGSFLFTMNPDGSGVTQLIPDASSVQPAWSPDGSRIVFVKGANSQNAGNELYVVNADGTGLTRLTSDGTTSATIRSDQNPAWSPDGARIVWQRQHSANSRDEIFVMDAVDTDSDGNGDNRVQLTFLEQAGTAGGMHPSWSPDGTRIAFSRTYGGTFSISVMNADGTNQTQIGSNSTSNFDNDAVWSPDGSRIAFSRITSGSREIYTISPDGSALTRLTNNSGIDDDEPTWSPDGTKITFRSGRDITRIDFNYEIYVMDANGANQTRLTNYTGRDEMPTWGALAATPTPTPTPTPSPSPTPTPSPSPSPTPTPTYSIGGFVEDVDGSLIFGARLILTGDTNGDGATDTTRSTTTTSIGYSFTDLPAGTYVVTVSADNRSFSPDTRTVSLPTNESGGNASVTFRAARATPPANDNIQNAANLSGISGTVSGTNANATVQRQNNFRPDIFYPNEPLHDNKPGSKSIWYRWTAPAVGNVTFNTENSAFDTLLAVYQVRQTNAIPGVTPAFSLFAPVVSNDDANRFVQLSSVSFRAERNATYFIAIDGYNGKTGSVNLRYAFVEIKPAPPVAVVTEIYAGKNKAPVACTNDSDPAGICSDNFDAGGFFIVTLKGRNFRSNSRVILNGDELNGFDRSGNPVRGFTTFISTTELEAHIPPSPPLDLARDGQLRVITPVSSAAMSNSVKVSPKAIAAGEYALAANIGVLNVIELRNAVIPFGETREVCGSTPFNKPDEEICITYNNRRSDRQTITISVTNFLSTITDEACLFLSNGNAGDYEACRGFRAGTRLAERSFAINTPGFQQSGANSSSIKVRSRLAVPTELRVSIASGQTLPQLMVEGGKIISNDGASIISGGGGNIISNDGASIISGGAGNIISGGAGNIISGGAGNIISGGGGNFTPAGTFSSLAFNGESPGIGGSFAMNSIRSQPVRKAADLVDGSAGLFVVRGSGGSAPTVTITADPVTGEPIYTAEITLDDTSNPRISDVQGLAFTFALNAPVIQFAANNITVDEGAGRATVKVIRTGDTTGVATVQYATRDGAATEGTNYAPAFGKVVFAPGETEKLITIPIIDNAFGTDVEAAQHSFNLIIGNQVGAAVMMPNVATITITNNDAATSATNTIDTVDGFVRQHYLDFLSREPDAPGFDHWTREITGCADAAGRRAGETEAQCTDRKRINTSGAFFLSLEFQATGYYAYRFYQGSLGRHPRLREYMSDVRTLASGIIVDNDLSPTIIEANKAAFARQWVTRPEFRVVYDNLTNEQFVDRLFATTRIAPIGNERAELIAELNAGTGTLAEHRASVLQKIVDGTRTVSRNGRHEQTFETRYGRAFYEREYNSAFVLMQYFVYLRRDPDAAGYQHWLAKLNQFNGDFVAAQMVRAFIVSTEYRARFG